jgi:porphobilinogen synthase
MLRQVQLAPADFVYPLFVTAGQNVKTEIPSMPGQFQLSIDHAVEQAGIAASLGIPAVILFGIPENKDAIGSGSFANDGVIQQATRAIKSALPEMVVIADACLCEYTDHGHCGVLNPEASSSDTPGLPPGFVLNDETLEILGQVAVSQAHAGADIIAPSGMIDGMVAAIRQSLDTSGYSHVAIMSYSIKYASAFYGPFRDAADGAPRFGDRKTHQMDPANLDQAFLEADLDVEQGADYLMVKPALAYLDIIQRTKSRHPGMPLVAYNVSGEYAMIKAAAAQGWINEKDTVLETLTGIKRAGADLIISYHALDVCNWIRHE